MNIVIRKGFVNPVDVTRYLDEETDQILSQDLGRRAFQRTFGDMRLRLGNIGGMFNTLFKDTHPGDRWQVEVYESDRYIFRGFINNKSIDCLLKTKWVEFDTFSATRTLVDRAKCTRVHTGPLPLMRLSPGSTLRSDYVRLEELLDIQNLITNLNEGGYIFSGFDLGEYSDRPVRGWTNAAAPIGNDGRFCDLDPETTWDQLLQAMSKYYNAEFFVDPGTGKLVMRRRGITLSDRKMDIDPLVKDDFEPVVRLVEENQIDYLYTMFKSRHVKPQIVSYYEASGGIVIGGMDRGWHGYIMTSVMDGMERLGSDEVGVDLPEIQHNRFRVKLRLPASFEGTEERRVYRRNGQSEFRLVPILTQKDNEERLVEDWWNEDLSDQPAMPYVTSWCSQWIRFDEGSGNWQDPILDLRTGPSSPNGEILEIIPELNFMEIGMPTQRKNLDTYDVFCFFGQEHGFDDPKVRAQWEDIFRTKRAITCHAKGTDYQIGDAFFSGGKFIPYDLRSGSQLLVRHAENNFTKKETELVLLTI